MTLFVDECEVEDLAETVTSASEIEEEEARYLRSRGRRRDEAERRIRRPRVDEVLASYRMR